MGCSDADDLSIASDTYSDAEDEEVSLIDYARYYGLSKDYTSSYPLSSCVLQSIPVWDDSDFSQLPDFVLSDKVDTDEKWTINHQSALFLRRIALVEAVPSIDIERRVTRSAEFKVEPLLLLTDSELDQRRFVRARRSKQSQGLQDMLLGANWEEDETHIYWPSSDLPAELIEKIKQERLQLDKTDILFLQQCVSTLEKPECEDILPSHKKASYPVPLELSKFEESMDLDDEFSLDGLSAFEIEEFSDSYTTSPLKRKRPEDFKVEVPLSPALLSSSPTKKTKIVTFSDELCTTIPDYAKPFPLGDSNSADERYDEALKKVLKASAESAVSAIENEQLTQADSTLRVEIPTIDQSGPLPPWEMFSRNQLGFGTSIEAQQQMISMLRRETISPREVWSGVVRINRAMTRWRPFDTRLSDLPKEEITCDDLDDFKNEEPQDTTSGWKLDGLRILDACEDDDEAIEFADMPIILERLGSTETMPEGKAWSEKGGPKLAAMLQPRQPLFPLSRVATHTPLEGLKPHKSPAYPQPLLGNTFSASNSLYRFMQIQTGKKASPKVSEESRLQATTSPIHIAKPTSKFTARIRDSESLQNPRSLTSKISPSMQSMMPSIHLPSLPDPVPPRTFVLSSTMFDRRALIKHIERLNPTAEYIERDFASARSLRGVSSQTSEADEADMILAPGHGILLTTLQKLIQKNLPGQVTRNVVRERIVQLARRYERLIVMVHEDRAGSQQRPLDSRESGEIVSLVNFCAAQSHEIQVMYIPGDEIALAIWIVASMVRFGLNDPEVQLLQDETSWELFLRKAGMDVFAAQVILIKLKVPDSVPSPSGKRQYGLPAFVMMGEAERLRRFGGLFGGEKILRKVSMAIDGRLIRAAVAGDLKR
ncbi:hypothetical protein D6C87_09501 [Aureobasidium pullulans]|uniref:Uncharacterized protein n=1 Tax=Aureobasidium pullulans TaxID=5580 RepID=A0AB38M312_AURPU|nr:hypothetical protein D6C94_03293 [Aureobasidium pullulans]THZ35922.1 hypothetical protein D6C87_09501 [Aureobasidium pullulans]